jgi:hypothetical protein
MAEEGRPSKLTPEIQERVVQALTLGNHRQDAAAYVGLHPRTLRRWLLRGLDETEGPYADFLRAVVEAEARAKITAMGCITKAARDGDWKAAAWWLQKKFPHQFSEQSQLFLISHAFQQLEAAAEAAGTPLPQAVWETAWANLAREFSQKLPAMPGVPRGLEPGEIEESLEDVDLSEDDKQVLLKLLRATKEGRPEAALPVQAGDGNGPPG